MRKNFLFCAMLVVVLFANAQFTSDDDGKEHPVIAVRNGKIGWVSSKDTNKVLIPFEYDGVFLSSYIRPSSPDDYEEYINNPPSCYGFVSTFSFLYADAYNILDNVVDFPPGNWVAFPVFVIKDNKLGLIDCNGKALLPFECTNILLPLTALTTGVGISGDMGFFIVQRNKKFGVFSVGDYEVWYTDMYVNTNPILIPCEYDSVEIDGDHFKVVKNGKSKHIDFRGRPLK
jgi:hypothetical protein